MDRATIAGSRLGATHGARDADRMRSTAPPPVRATVSTAREAPVAGEVAAIAQPADRALLAFTLTLVGIGLVMVYSSSTVIGAAKFDGAGYFMLRQVIHAAIGIALLVAASRVPLDLVRRITPSLFFAGFALLVAVLFMPAHNGAHRWIHVPGLTFQPSDVARLAIVLFLADRLARQQELLASFAHGLVPHLVLIAVVLALIIVEPNLSTAVAIALTAGAVMVAARVRIRHLALLGAGAAALVVLLIVAEPYRMRRLTAYLSMIDEANAPSYQIQQGFVALGSGGIFGRGLGKSLQKFFFLPEPYTDSIYPIIGEEFGLVGAAVVLALYAGFGWRGMAIARRQHTLARFLLATGLVASVMIYATLNIGVMTGLLPPTGLPLPFISYGGTALLVNLVMAGLLLNLSRLQIAPGGGDGHAR